MDENSFLTLLQDTLQCEEALRPELPLADVPEWDSLAAMAVLALGSRRFGRKLKLTQLRKAVTVGDLYALLGTG
ncbi:MAG: acyl carrier protein [Desulfovibrio sp.]|jgi:acyl carrier protein|nr:acyl carrier protein [Desulfovibrio sp.]